MARAEKGLSNHAGKENLRNETAFSSIFRGLRGS